MNDAKNGCMLYLCTLPVQKGFCCHDYNLDYSSCQFHHTHVHVGKAVLLLDHIQAVCFRDVDEIQSKYCKLLIALQGNSRHQGHGHIFC